MFDNETGKDAVNNDDMMKGGGGAAPFRLGQQIDTGFYEVWQDASVTGYVFSEYISGTVQREHWVLLSGFTHPSSNNTDVSWRIKRDGTKTLSDLLEKTGEGDYIIATCVLQGS